MPALAMRFTGGTAGRLHQDAHDAMRAGLDAGGGHAPREPVCARLAAEFLTVRADVVRRCVADAGARAEHLGVEVTPAVLERLAREGLLALVNSTPPTGP